MTMVHGCDVLAAALAASWICLTDMVDPPEQSPVAFSALPSVVDSMVMTVVVVVVVLVGMPTATGAY